MVSQLTSTGTLLLVLVPLPSWPYEFAPQHLTPPPAVSAQECSPPALTAFTPLVSHRHVASRVGAVAELARIRRRGTNCTPKNQLISTWNC